VDRSDHEIVLIAVEMGADGRLVCTLVSDLHAEADVYPPIGPPFGCLADAPLAIGEGRERVRGPAGIEVDVVGDRDLRDALRHRAGGEHVDRDVAVGREVGVEVTVERKVVVGRR
jgi:hypothetical protein